MSPAVRRQVSRLVRILVPIAVLAVILGAVGTVGFVQFSSTPGFCKSCHIMRPYYDSWAASSHRNVPCIECHIAPGIKAEAMTKVQAANMVVKYFTGAYGTRPWADIDDAACLRSGCHSERLIEGLVDYKGVQFDHTKHLGEVRRGIQLRCTSCHSQIVQGSHIAVTPSTCFLCHFKDRPVGEPIGGCIGCHPNPPRVTSPEGYVIDHPQFVKDRVDCLSCHSSVTHGTGDADSARCIECHNLPEELAKFNDPPLMHKVHVADHHIDCLRCHTPIQHKIEALKTNVALDCQSCHRQVHADQQRLLAGIGGHGVPPTPSTMYLARVTCLSCHGDAKKLAGHDTVQVADEASCLSCHGVRYANVLPGWQSAMDRKLALVAPVVNAAVAAVPRTSARTRHVADSLVTLAKENVDFVRVGRGAHNVVYADRLLRAALTLIGDAVREGRLPYALPKVNLGPPVAENACLQCHLGIEHQQGTFQTEAFSHAPHVVAAGMACTECHSPLSDHGKITLTSRAACDNCHHPVAQPRECSQCHAGGGGAPSAPIVLPSGTFSHKAHIAANLTCDACHTAPLMSARDLVCDNCHEQHHQPTNDCLSCHKGGVLAKHTIDDHVACVQCHASVPHINRWTRQVCTTCHADKVQHYPGRACEVCHKVPPMGATRHAAPPKPGGSGTQ